MKLLFIAMIGLSSLACATQSSQAAQVGDQRRTVQETDSQPKFVRQIQSIVAKVQMAKTADAASDAAQHIAHLTQNIKNNEIPKALLNKIMSLLDSPYDSVRYWAAIALGNLGTRARIAIPKLKSMLPEAECINGVITSASGIRYALIHIGAGLPPPPTCQPISG